MGCVNGKCCSCGRCLPSADSESRTRQSVRNKQTVRENVLESMTVASGNFHLEYSFHTQPGYYPDTPEKENQDIFCVKTQIQGRPDTHFFGVFDGHGQFGMQCSHFASDALMETLSNDPTLSSDPVKSYGSAFTRVNSALHESEIDDSMSGTTAITVLIIGDVLFVANVGDSRAIVAVKDGTNIVAENLSFDQTPFRKDECERVKHCGARVLSVDQVEGLKDPDIQSWGDEETDGGDPPRLWVQNGMYPGTAFTRSIGDSVAETIGVTAMPEISILQLTPDHLFFVIASDGVFEFLTSQDVVDMVAMHRDPGEACAAIAGEAYKLWLENENRTDDITLIVVYTREGILNHQHLHHHIAK